MKIPGSCGKVFLKKVWHAGFDQGQIDLDEGGMETKEAAAKEAAVKEVFSDAVVVGEIAADVAQGPPPVPMRKESLLPATKYDKEWENATKEFPLAKQAMSWAESFGLSVGLAPELVRSLRDLGISVGMALKD